VNPPEPIKTSALAFGPRMLSSLTNPHYRLYFFGTIAHFAAMSMSIVSSPMLVFRLTNSTALLGMMALIGAGPMLIVSLFGGAFADRLQKKKLLVAGMLSSAVIVSIIGTALTTGTLNSENHSSWWILFISSAVQGVTMGMMMPAMQAIIPEIVDRDKLMNAIALNTTGMNVLNLVAPPIAGWLIDHSGFQTVYFTMAGFYVCSAVIISFLPARTKITATGHNILEDIQKGFSYIRRTPMIFQILAFTLIVVVFCMPYQQFIPVYVDSILHAGATGSGIINGVCGGGSLIGSLLLAAWPGKKRGLMLFGSGILAGVSLTIFSFSSYLWLSLIFIFFVGLSQALRNTIGSTLLQTYTQAEYMGRVISITNVQWGFMSLCTFFVGMLADVFDVQWVLGSMAMILVVLSLIFFSFFPKVRRID
jgi:MFS family permease